jgi:quercetin dioxygenase-like cupin family protein
MPLRMLSTKLLPSALLVSALLLGGGDGRAAEEAKPPASKGTPLLTQDLTGMPGKEVVMLTVEYPPGGASSAHRHDADVFVYVLEGSMIMQVDGQSPVTLTVGQTFHEKPSDIHRTSANASKTAPAKFVVFIVKDKGKPVTTPVAPTN